MAGQELYGLGARRIGVMSVPVIGCVPSQIHRGHWVGAYREDAQSMPTMQLCSSTPKLSTQMDSLNQLLPDARLVPILISTIQPLL
ncbi:hypothetical protein Pyn_11743 [Prunus yedoensis var. nudiflora]|uniref:GDSL esterase/lipase n=1 Tax=Prunus yedoensis var. nudiflora TaxID=2094558 RepID=A0A314UDA8_PRUYE|nr:hypothetical protein Pyn_11743 [Prunus yedoensis var. nudiflora]